MAAERHSPGAPVLVVLADQPLIGIVFIEDGREVIRYFANEADAAAAVADHDTQDARTLAGVWIDLDWAETEGELDRIRHESRTTTPADDR